MSEVISIKEAGAKMTKARVLALYAQGNIWLVEQLRKDAQCDCGSCHLCGYRFIEKALSATPE